MARKHSSQSTTLPICPQAQVNQTFSLRNASTVWSSNLHTRLRASFVSKPGFKSWKLLYSVFGIFDHNVLLQSVLLTPIVRDEQCQLAGLMASVKARMAPWLYQEVKELQMMLNTGIKNYRTLWVNMVLLSDQYFQNLNHLVAISNNLGFKCILFLAF